MKKYGYSFILIVIWIVTSCGRIGPTINNVVPSETATLIVSKEELAFLRIFPVDEMNTYIKFWSDVGFLDDGRCIDLSLENVSEERIIFPSDFGIKILTLSNEGVWNEIENSERYVPEGKRQVSPKGTDIPGVIGIVLCPILTDFDLPIEIRVVVMGQTEVTQGKVPKPTGAYIDLIMKK